MKKEFPPGAKIFLLLVMVVLGLMFFAQFFFVFSIPFLGDYSEYEADPDAPKYVFLVAFCSMLGLWLFAVFIYSKIVGNKLKDDFPRVKWNYRTFFIVFGILVVGWFVSDGLYLLNKLIINQFPELGYQDREAYQNELYAKTFNKENLRMLPVALFTFAALPAFIEEIVFRRHLLPLLQEVSQNLHFGVLVSALLFTAFHPQPWNLLPIFGMGIILGYIYVYTKDIRYSMAVHFIYNAVQITMMYFAPELVM